MGHTHYFPQAKHATQAQWKAITDEFKKLMAAALITQALPIQREEDSASEPLIDKDQIIFNGIEDDGHETMILERIGHGFQFCKTAHKPYNAAVIALLLIADKHAPGVWEIASDGDTPEWQEVVDWLAKLGMGDYVIPARVRDESMV